MSTLCKTQAFVLKKSDFRETSLLVRFFSADFGKLTCLFKGIRCEPEKFASRLEPFSLNEVIFYKSDKNEINLASQCDNINNYDALRSDLNKVYDISSMLNLVDSIMQPQEISVDTFGLLKSCLDNVASGQDSQKILAVFKIKLLSLSGFQPRIDSCVGCSCDIGYAHKTFFSLKCGGLLCQNCIIKDRTARLIYRGTIASLSYIQKNDFASNLRLGMNTLIRKELSSLLDTFLAYHLEKSVTLT